jgi:hypothetical protein
MPRHAPQPPPKADDPEQSKRFIDMAREVEADEDPEAMERAFGRVVKPRNVTPSGSHSRRSGKQDAP